jgi:protein SCO1/2
MDVSEKSTAAGKGRGFNGIAVAFAIAALMIVGLLVGRFYFGPGSQASNETVTTTSPLIGGPFTLVDQNGATVTDADFKGKFMLVYFGYTFCPDVCPTALNRNSAAMDILGEQEDKVVPILITVDPARDTVAHMKQYATFFHPRLVALTGSDEQVKAAAKAYRVYFAKVEEEGGDPDNYLMDHTAITFMMGPDGKFVQHFSHDATPEDMAERMRKVMAEAGA